MIVIVVVVIIMIAGVTAADASATMIQWKHGC